MSTLLYNPDRKSKKLLISEFVVRTREYEEIMQDLETSAMEHPEQHYLLVGQRGTGKSTLLQRIKYGIEDAEKLNTWLIPVLLTEEQYHVTELANLWESVAQYLEDYHGFDGLTEKIENNLGRENFEEISFDLLEEHLHQHRKKLVLLIDNFGDLLKKLEKTEIHRLREILQTKEELRLIAGSPFYLESVLDYHQPLFDFFKVIRLEGLNQQETQKMLLKLGELHGEQAKIKNIIQNRPERIETLRTLTGGVPRTIALMFRVFVEHHDEGTVKDLERILDAVTPLYKHRMDDLPVQQQKIVDAVARHWDAISVKELREKVRLESKIISAQLRQLEKNQVIEKRETGTKNHLYLLKERFFNIWYLMRYGRKDDRQRVIWLVKFLESWCSSSELNSRILDYVEKIKSGAIDEETINFFGQVYAALQNLDPKVKILLKSAVSKEVSGGIYVSEAELYEALEQLEKDKKWDRILQTVLTTYYDTLRVKHIIQVALVNSIDTRINDDSIRELAITILDKSLMNYNKNTTSELTEAELHIYKSILLAFAQYSLYSGDVDNVFYSIKTYIGLTNEKAFLYAENTLEYIYLKLTFSFILWKQHYNLLIKIFTEIKEANLIEIFKPIYYAIFYLRDGSSSPEFLKAGPELQEAVASVIDEVEKIKIKFPNPHQ